MWPFDRDNYIVSQGGFTLKGLQHVYARERFLESINYDVEGAAWPTPDSAKVSHLEGKP